MGILIVIILAAIIMAGFIATEASDILIGKHFRLSDLMRGVLYSLGGLITFIIVRFAIWSKKPEE